MTMVIRVVQRDDAWLIEVGGEYFGPLANEDMAFAHANLTALKLQLDDFTEEYVVDDEIVQIEPEMPDDGPHQRLDDASDEGAAAPVVAEALDAEPVAEAAPTAAVIEAAEAMRAQQVALAEEALLEDAAADEVVADALPTDETPPDDTEVDASLAAEADGTELDDVRLDDPAADAILDETEAAIASEFTADDIAAFTETVATAEAMAEESVAGPPMASAPPDLPLRYDAPSMAAPKPLAASGAHNEPRAESRRDAAPTMAKAAAPKTRRRRPLPTFVIERPRAA